MDRTVEESHKKKENTKTIFLSVNYVLENNEKKERPFINDERNRLYPRENLRAKDENVTCDTTLF